MQADTSLRDKLHSYIDVADEQKLHAIYILLEEEIEKTHTYSNEEIALFYERRSRYLAGEGKSYSVKESIKKLRTAIN